MTPTLPWHCAPTKGFGGHDHATEWSIWDERGRRVARVQAAGGTAKDTAELIVRLVNKYSVTQ